LLYVYWFALFCGLMQRFICWAYDQKVISSVFARFATLSSGCWLYVSLFSGR